MHVPVNSSIVGIRLTSTLVGNCIIGDFIQTCKRILLMLSTSSYVNLQENIIDAVY